MGNSDQEVYIYKPCSSLTYYPKPKLWLDSLNTQAYISLSCQFLTNVSFLCLESNKSCPLWPLFSPEVDFFFFHYWEVIMYSNIKFISFVCSLLCHSMGCEGPHFKTNLLGGGKSGLSIFQTLPPTCQSEVKEDLLLNPSLICRGFKVLIKKLDEVRFFKLEKKWLWRLLEIILKKQGHLMAMASFLQGWEWT